MGRNRNFALAGNRTRASRVAGENSTTEPPVLAINNATRQYNSQNWMTVVSVIAEHDNVNLALA